MLYLVFMLRTQQEVFVAAGRSMAIGPGRGDRRPWMCASESCCLPIGRAAEAVPPLPWPAEQDGSLDVKGVRLVGFYLILAVMFYLIPA